MQASCLGRPGGPGVSVNHPFLPLLQMSESETLITMVNHMVENSSPRAQLFMQVRPQSDSMGLSAVPAGCACFSWPLWGGLAAPSLLIYQASSPRFSLASLHSS